MLETSRSAKAPATATDRPLDVPWNLGLSLYVRYKKSLEEKHIFSQFRCHNQHVIRTSRDKRLQARALSS